MVFQNYALYPHMTVAENIGFALRMRKVPKAEARRRIEETARIIGLVDHLDRKPRQLSGGQRQRVAMGRAIVREPQVFLMDEPLSNLDAKLRVQMRAEISRIQRQLGVTTVYVTHDQVEAMTMGDRVAVLRRGVLQQFDAPQHLYEHPANLFVASFIGSPGDEHARGTLERDGDGPCSRLGSATLPVPCDAATGLGRHAGKRIALGIRPEALTSGGSRRRRTRPPAWHRARGRGARSRAARIRRARGVPGSRRGRGRGARRHGRATDLVEIKQEGTARGRSSSRGSTHRRGCARTSRSTLGRPRRLHFFDLDSGSAIGA